MDLLHNLSNLFVFQFPGTLLSAQPTVICRSGDTEQFARCFYRISIFFFCFLYCQVDMGLPNLTQPRLLSISSNFFSRSRSIFVMYNSCSSCAILTLSSSSVVRGPVVLSVARGDLPGQLHPVLQTCLSSCRPVGS